MLIALIKTMRPRQWTKNGFVFFGLIFDKQLFLWGPLLRTLEGFALFCLISSAVYLFNDIADVEPDRKRFAHLRYAPFVVELSELFHKWGDLRLEGYIQGKLVITKRYSGKGVDQKFTLLPDDTSLIADGADSTRVVLRVTDEFDAIRPFADDAIKFDLEGPAEQFTLADEHAAGLVRLIQPLVRIECDRVGLADPLEKGPAAIGEDGEAAVGAVHV